MASTKIINVLKDDKFEEILDLFRNTLATEVIFVLPKTSKAFKSESHFSILGNEAARLDKKVTLLCSNPNINKLAKKYKFDVLLAKSSDDRPLGTAMNPEQEENIEEAAIFQENNNENDEYQVITTSNIQRGLEGIVRQDGIPLKISSKREQPTNLNVKKKTIHQTADDIKNIWQEQDERTRSENIWTDINNKTKKSFRNFSKKSLIGLGVISIILLGTIIYISTGSANIDITPHKQPLDIQLRISTSDKFPLIEVELNKIPGQLFNVEKSSTQTFLATGEKEVAQKARGKITVFNEYGTTPQVLIATTRFQTPDGLIFRTLKGITVPGTKVENGKIIPGSINVEVVADKPGQSYNIPESKFSIPAFNERSDIGRYEKIYGKSNEAMKGGAIGKVKVVTSVDFNTAKQTLSDKVTKDVQDSLKTQTSELKIINTSDIKLMEPESTTKTDEAADEFIMTVSSSITTVGFKEDDLKTLIKQSIEKTQNLIAIPEKLTISYNNIVFNETSNILAFTVNVKGNSYDKINIDKIRTDLLGKNEKEIKNYFKGAMGVDTAKVVLSPFWVKRIPKDKERTTLQINY